MDNHYTGQTEFWFKCKTESIVPTITRVYKYQIISSFGWYNAWLSALRKHTGWMDSVLPVTMASSLSAKPPCTSQTGLQKSHMTGIWTEQVKNTVGYLKPLCFHVRHETNCKSCQECILACKSNIVEEKRHNLVWLANKFRKEIEFVFIIKVFMVSKLQRSLT